MVSIDTSEGPERARFGVDHTISKGVEVQTKSTGPELERWLSS